MNGGPRICRIFVDMVVAEVVAVAVAVVAVVEEVVVVVAVLVLVLVVSSLSRSSRFDPGIFQTAAPHFEPQQTRLRSSISPHEQGTWRPWFGSPSV